jgi:plasmid stability protein
VKESLATRVEAPLRHRLRVFAAVSGRTVEDVVSAALDNYLPPVPAEMALVMASSGPSENRSATPAR